MAPTSRFENPSTRVYSSPKPTQPDSSTMGDDSASPQKSTRSGPSLDEARAWAAAFMRRALYDARRMQTQAVLITPLLVTLVALAGASTSAVAQGQAPAPGAAPPPATAPAGPGFTASEDVPSPRGFTDAYLLDEIKLGGEVLNEDEQLARWQAELNAGRARAGAMLGAYYLYRALTPSDCTAARDPLTKAEQLGSDQAPWQLAKLAGNDTCGPPNRAERERWLKQAVVLDYPGAVLELIKLNADLTNPAERLNRYIYARVAAGYW